MQRIHLCSDLLRAVRSAQVGTARVIRCIATGMVPLSAIRAAASCRLQGGH